MSEKILNVRLLGGFSVQFCDEIIVAEGSRVTKAMILLQFLLMNRDRVVTQEELINVLLDEDESDNPANALKNIVYRLRKMFEAEGFKGEDIIIFKKNTYHLSENYTYKLDIEDFDYLLAKSKDETLTDEEKAAYLFEALGLYKGELLPKESGEMWLIPISIDLQKKYIFALSQAYDICEKLSEYDEIYNLLNKAITIYPYEEELHAMRIGCLISKKQYDKASSDYEKVCSMLFDELGVMPGEALVDIYNKLSNSERPINESIADVRLDMSEKEFDDGAFFSNIQTFKTTYRFVVRNFERNGISVFLILCTLRNLNGSMLARGDALTKASRHFDEAVKKSMRHGDLYTRYNPSQFLIMLSNITQENCKVVIDRIERNFFKSIGKLEVSLNCQIISAVDIDSIMSNNTEEAKVLSW